MMQCSHDCNNSTCPFTQDLKNPNRYVCLRCGLERNLNYSQDSGGGTFLLTIFLAILLIILAIRLDREPETPPSPQQSSQFYGKVHQ